MSRDRFDVLERFAPLFDAPEPSFTEFLRRRERKQRNGRVVSAVVVLAVAAVGIGALVRTFYPNTVPAGDPRRSVFAGTWVSTDTAGLGSAQTMVISVGGEAVEIVVRDAFDPVCSGAPSTMTGTGRLEGASKLVIPSPVLTCDDGSELESLSPPIADQLRNMTFVYHSSTDALSDNLGLIWERDRQETSEATLSSRRWPQSSREEVREAQELADAGDPGFTWQVDPRLYALTTESSTVRGGPYQGEIFTRFLREELGWQEFRGAGVAGHLYGEGSYGDVAFVRCAPGRTNPLYPDDPEGRGCAPTIDELRYETVQIDAEQLARKGPSGIWVVTGWALLPPSAGPITFYTDFSGKQIEQVPPPSDAEITGLLEAFLQSRIEGEGAQEYLHTRYVAADEIPLLYATTSGAPYQRFEIERLEGPLWPLGLVRLELRLFADGGNTVVEQRFSLYREGDGRLGVEFVGEGTTENGEVVAVPSSILDGQVTFSARRPPWYDESAVPELGFLQARADQPINGASIWVLPNSLSPQRPCDANGGVPPSAEALVGAIRSDPDLEATAPVPDRIGGIDALRLDVAAVPGAATCVGDAVDIAPSPYSDAGFGLLYPGDRGRLYVLDLPDGIQVRPESGPAETARTLTILITAPEATFDLAVKATEPIVDSLEFRAG